MIDRFDAQLRAHLIDTADPRLAAGQVAAVVERVAVTAQRPSLVARLTWFPGRIGPISSTAARYGLVAALVGATILAAILVGGPRPSSSGFEGTWTSTDPLDGSAQHLVIGAGSTPAVHFVDENATAGSCGADAVKVFTADGRGTVDGDRLSVVWPDGGGCGLATIAVAFGPYTLDQATDTIVDGQHLRWTRASGTEPVPTRGPLPSNVPDASGCFDVPAGATYRNDVGSQSLTVAIPADAAITWQGVAEGFGLEDECFFGSPPVIGASIVTSVDGSCETNDTVAVGTPDEAVAALTSARGVTVPEPSVVTLGGYAATRFEIPPDGQRCFDVVPLWNGFDIGRDLAIIYIIDVEGSPLALTITDGGGTDRASAIAEAEAILDSLRIEINAGAQPPSAPVATPDADCLQFDGTGTYTAPVGPLSVTATLPDEPATYWSASPGWFRLLRSPCGFDAPLTFEAQLVSKVAVDACRGLGESVEVGTAAEAATALADQASTNLGGPTDLTIDGNHAVRVEITVPPDLDATTCDEDAALLLGQTAEDAFIRIDPGWTYSVYLVDVEGSVLALTSLHETDAGSEDPTIRGEIDAIIGSLQLKELGR